MPDYDDYDDPRDAGYYRGYPDLITFDDLAYDSAMDRAEGR